MAYSVEERTKIVEKIQGAVRSGTPLSRAIEKAGISFQTYQNWAKPGRGKGARKASQKAARAPRTPRPTQVCVVYGSAMIFGSAEQMSQLVKTLH